jgi:TonB family protein
METPGSIGRGSHGRALGLAALLSLFGSVCLAQAKASAPGGYRHGTTEQVCQLISANPSDFNAFQFVPKGVDFTRLNRRPKVSFVVNEDGSVSNVKVLKGTGSPKVDAGLVKSIRAWKYKPQPGCTVETSMSVLIDIGQG